MNPLGGGIIPRHGDLFNFLKRPGEGTVAAALSFLWDHRDISVTLVGFDDEKQIGEALAAMEVYQPRSEGELAEVKSRASASFEGLCTGCGYCDECPQDIPIPKFMDAYNQKLLNEAAGTKAIISQIKNHWNLAPAQAKDCVECGQCENACTQHIDIINRLKTIAGAAAD
jgi:predicted aldo/keto reductase-like oxidoreductase